MHDLPLRGIGVAARENDPASCYYALTRQVIVDLDGVVDTRGQTLQVHIIDNSTGIRPDWNSGMSSSSAVE